MVLYVFITLHYMLTLYKFSLLFYRIIQIDIMTSSNHINDNDDEENAFDGLVKRGRMGRITSKFDKDSKVRLS